MTKYYVTCTDKFLSGWGLAENRISKFVIECDNYNDAYVAQKNLSKEPCFKYVKIHVGNLPYYSNKKYHVSVKSFAECSAYNH